MQEERKRILQLVENGVISAEEAIGLLEKLSLQKESTPSSAMPSTQPVLEKQQARTPAARSSLLTS